MNVAPISSPLPGEHLAKTSPEMRPESDPNWRQRLNFWPGRALTADALEIEQEHRAAHLAWQGRVTTPGIISGLEVGIEGAITAGTGLTMEGHFIHVLPGHAFTVYGEDVMIPRPLRISLDEIPIRYVRFRPPGDGPPAEPPPSGTTRSTPLEFGGVRLEVDDFGAGHVPWAAVLVARPSEFGTFGNVDPSDPCELDPTRDAFADERRLDATAFWLFQLPVAWESDPLLLNREDPRWRNRLAHVVFSSERSGSSRQYIRFRASQPSGSRWDTLLEEDVVFPWEFFGVPLALLSLEFTADSQRRFFLDRASVTRPGDRARTRSRTALTIAQDPAALPPPGAGTPALWRARVDQFAEHLSSLAEIAPVDQAVHFQFVPPAGLLPRAALNFLTTEEAIVLPPSVPGQPPDRAAMSSFFPSAFAVEAVPIPTEDLDAALASSAPLAPFDFAAPGPDTVRVLVPLAQRVFDPQVLVVDPEDPFFAAEVARLIAVRQDWRQRVDFVRARRDELQAAIAGPQPLAVTPVLGPGQIEKELVESVNELGFALALLSPGDTSGPWEVGVQFAQSHSVTPATTLFVQLRLDLEASPGRIEARWRRGGEEFKFVWTAPFASTPAVEDPERHPTPLWLRLTVRAAELGVTDGVLEGLTLRFEEGRVALSAAGDLAPGESRGSQDAVVWWGAGETNEGVTFKGGDWTKIRDKHLLAPFEDQFEPAFADGRSLDARKNEVEDALNPKTATPRAKPLSVNADGLARVLTELNAEANEADDFVDAHFTRAQTNLYRIRKLVLGQSAAQKLLINPAIATIAEQETATATADQLSAFLNAAKAKGNTIKVDMVNAALKAPISSRLQKAPPPGEAAPPISSAGGKIFLQPTNPFVTNPGIKITPATPIFIDIRPEITTIKPSGTTPNISGHAVFESEKVVPRIGISPQMKEIVGQLPEAGPTLPPRGLSIGERFKEPPATANLSYSRAALNDLLEQLPRLSLPLVEENVRSLSNEEVSLLDLQGRSLPVDSSGNRRDEALKKMLHAAEITLDTDEAEVTLAALDFVEIKSAILRTIERVIQQRRALLQRGQETIAVVDAEVAAANARLTAIAAPLAEARHDVSVARALRQEERARVAAINAQRDTLIRDEVKFLAYVRPRAVDPVRRNVPGWKLESAGTLAPVPACLRQHDQPPDALRAYVQLFRNAPARWFSDIAPRLRELDTREKLIELLAATQRSALQFSTENRLPFAQNVTSVATQSVLLSGYSIVAASRTVAAGMQLARPDLRSWEDFRREAEQHSSLGDVIDGRHGHPDLARAAANVLGQIEGVATCLHAEFAAVAPAIRLVWVERYSQFDRPAPLNNLTALPRYGSLDRAARRRFQSFVDWIFQRVNTAEKDAFNLINDLVRICLLLASHAPVKGLIAGHLPRPVPVRLGTLIPIRAFDPRLVRVGMEVHVWQAEKIVARARVEDLRDDGEISARVERIQTTTTTLDQTMRVQFVAPALGFAIQLAQP